MSDLTLPGNVPVSDPLNPLGPNLGPVQRTGSFNTIGEIVSSFLPYIISIAGIILFFSFIWGGFILLTSAGSPEKVKQGQSLIVSSLIGFAVIFTAYWLIQIIAIVFGVQLGFGRS